MKLRLSSHYFIASLLLLWIIGWASLPGIGGAHSIEELSSGFHKITSKSILILFFAIAFSTKITIFTKFISDSKAIFLFILINLFLLSRSQNTFYSATRLIDFFLLISSAYLFLYTTRHSVDLTSKLTFIFKLLTLYLFTALIIFIFIPNWGAIGAGFNANEMEYTFRLGGTFIRIDAAASLAGACLAYWLFDANENGDYSTKFRICAIVISGTVLVLTYSRSVIIATSISFIYIYIKRTNSLTWWKLFIISISCVLFIIFGNQIFSLYTRNESIENIQTASGRLFTLVSMFNANSWFDLLVGNGFGMHSPLGLYVPVPELAQDMSSAHNGYLSVLLGSGLTGLCIIFWIHISLFLRIRSNDRKKSYPMLRWAFPAYLLLSISTLFDYGIWGIASPALLIFFLLYYSSMKVIEMETHRT